MAAAAHHNGGKVPMATAHAWWIGIERIVNSTDLAPDLSFAEKVRVLRAELGGLGVAAQTDALFVLVARDNSFERAPANVMALVDTELGIAMRQLRAGRAGTLPPGEQSSALMRSLALPSSIVDALLA